MFIQCNPIFAILWHEICSQIQYFIFYLFRIKTLNMFFSTTDNRPCLHRLSQTLHPIQIRKTLAEFRRNFRLIRNQNLRKIRAGTTRSICWSSFCETLSVVDADVVESFQVLMYFVENCSLNQREQDFADAQTWQSSSEKKDTNESNLK